MFAERLDLLMSLTGVRNNALAHAASLDASYISRLRRGCRSLPEGQTYVLPISCYLARQIRLPYQRQAICETLGLKTAWPDDEQRAGALIYAWLMGEELASAVSMVHRFLNELVLPKNLPSEGRPTSSTRQHSNSCFEKRELYYGIEGKCEALIRFLTEVRDSPASQTLLLFSDEEMSRLFADQAFIRRWAGLFGEILMSGNRVKIVHTVSRSMSEMMEAVTNWLPLYMVGSIEPYYYPWVRDGLFQRMMVIAPSLAAVVSNSVNRDSNDMLNLYIEDKAAIGALTTEYERLLACCRPLMRIWPSVNYERFWDAILTFAEEDAPAILLSPTPSLMSMPEAIASSLATRAKSPNLLNVWQRCVHAFEEGGGEQTDIVTRSPELEPGTVVPLPLGVSSRLGKVDYIADEYRGHWEHASALSKAQGRYRLQITDNAIENVMIYAKKGVGVVLAKLNAPTMMFMFDEPGMTAAFWEYLSAQRG